MNDATTGAETLPSLQLQIEEELFAGSAVSCFHIRIEGKKGTIEVINPGRERKTVRCPPGFARSLVQRLARFGLWSLENFASDEPALDGRSISVTGSCESGQQVRACLINPEDSSDPQVLQLIQEVDRLLRMPPWKLRVATITWWASRRRCGDVEL